jgi:hypothetical protein
VALSELDGRWLVDSVAITLFTMERFPANAWGELVGGNPVTSTRMPAIGTVEEEGSFDDAWLTLGGGSGHLALRLGPVPAERRGPSREWPVHIGALPDRAEQLVGFALKVLDGLEYVSRVGLGCALFNPVESARAGNEWIQRYVPAVKLDAESVDFLYRINRQRPFTFGAESILVHRLATFAVTPVATLLDPTGPTHVYTACRLDLDINTVQGQSLPRALPYDVMLRRFAEWALEIAAKGDVP